MFRIHFTETTLATIVGHSECHHTVSKAQTLTNDNTKRELETHVGGNNENHTELFLHVDKSTCSHLRLTEILVLGIWLLIQRLQILHNGTSNLSNALGGEPKIRRNG